MSRLRLIGVTFPASTIPTAADPTTPPVQPPSPGESAPTYPDTQPAPGSTVYDSGPSAETVSGGTLPVTPSFSLPVSVRRSPTARHETELGYVSAYATQTSNRRGLELTWESISGAERTTLKAFLDARMGADPPEGFTYQPAGQASGVWSVVRGIYVDRKIGPDAYVLRCAVNEAL